MKLRRIGYVVGGRSAELIDFLIHALSPVAGIWMVGEKLSWLLPFCFRIQLLKKLRHGPRVVAGIVQNLSAQDVRLGFVGARVFEQDRVQRKTRHQLRKQAFGGVSRPFLPGSRRGRM